MFRKKSLRFKISFVILLIIIVLTAAGIFLGNHFLEGYYINGKENALVSVFQNINSVYTDGLDTPDPDTDDDDNDNNDGKDSSILSSGMISEELALQLDRMSLSNNMSIIIIILIPLPQIKNRYNLQYNTKKYKKSNSAIT